MLQLSQLGNQRRYVGGLDTVKRQVEVENVTLREVAIARVQLRKAGAHRDGQRKIASDPFGVALDRDIDPIGPPGLAGPPIVDDDGRPTDAEPSQIVRGRIAFARSGKLLDHLRAEIGRRRVARPDLRDDHPARIAHQMHDRALDDHLRRHQLTVQQRAQFEARGHLGKTR